jgi:hypothetical protein
MRCLDDIFLFLFLFLYFCIHLRTCAEEWALKDLAKKLQLQPEATRSRLQFWISVGVMKQTGSGDNEVYRVVEELIDPVGGAMEGLMDSSRGGEEEGGAGAKEEEDEKMQENFVLGMLMTFSDGLPLERVSLKPVFFFFRYLTRVFPLNLEKTASMCLFCM